MPVFDTMTPADLEQGVSAALATGRIGTPVAARLIVHLPGLWPDREAWTAACIEIALRAIGGVPESLCASADEQRYNVNVLLRCREGQSVSVTVTCDAAPSAGMHMIVLGNHGLIRLEGGEFLDVSRPPTVEGIIEDAIERSLHSQNAVSITSKTRESKSAAN